eukprot:gene8795-biopygen8805
MTRGVTAELTSSPPPLMRNCGDPGTPLRALRPAGDPKSRYVGDVFPGSASDTDDAERARIGLLWLWADRGVGGWSDDIESEYSASSSRARLTASVSRGATEWPVMNTWSWISVGVIRTVGSFSSILLSRSTAMADSPQFSGKTSGSSDIRCHRLARDFAPSPKGIRPTSTRNSVTPSAQTSCAFSLKAPFPELASGLKNSGVPKVFSPVSSPSALISRDSPKSMYLTVPRSFVYTMFSGFISRWTTCMACR